jgi:pilus assembly protein CpaF
MQKGELLSLVDRYPKLLPLHTGSARSRKRPISQTMVHILESVQRELGFKYSDQENPQYIHQIEELESTIDQVALRLGFELTSFERDEILEQLEKDQCLFGILQDLVDDPQVSDIIVTDYQKVCIQQGRRNYATDIKFPNQQIYENFVERLLQRAGTTFSTKKPIADGMLGDYARLHAVHPSICQSGPYLTIRLNRFARVTLEDLIESGLAPKEIFAYLEAITFTGQTLLIVGEVGTGKTTLVRALAASIPPEESILVIEDTPEIQLEHPHVRYVRTREANSDGAGRIAPAECIRAGMRMAMNRILFGEMRDAEAAESFIDVCASGHPGMSTIHARSAVEAVSRLELFLGRAQRGAARNVLIEQIATAVQVIVFVDFCSETARRRIIEIREIGPVADGILRQREMFRYQVLNGVPSWRVVGRVSAYRDQIEDLDKKKVVISRFPTTLELEDSVLLKEVAMRRH